MEEQRFEPQEVWAPAFNHLLCCFVSMETRQQAVFFHPPRAGKRLFKLWRMVEDSAKPWFTLTPPHTHTEYT